MENFSKLITSFPSKKESILQFFSLSLLLGFELSYYLLIVQTGIVQHYHSNLLTLSPLLIGGVLGTFASGYDWGKISNPIHKIILALSLQLALSFLYPVYSFFTLGLLGLSVGMMAPLSIYLFRSYQKKELFFALAIAYSIGTYCFTSCADSRTSMAITFTSISLFSALCLYDYKASSKDKQDAYTFKMYLPLILWIFLDSNLFETLSRHEGLDIWSHFTYLIMAFHTLGLIAAFTLHISRFYHHLIILLLFVVSYLLSYLEIPYLLAMVYPFVISYYNVIVFRALSKEVSLHRLSVMMVFIGWIASGLGLMLALSRLIH